MPKLVTAKMKNMGPADPSEGRAPRPAPARAPRPGVRFISPTAPRQLASLPALSFPALRSSLTPPGLLPLDRLLALSGPAGASGARPPPPKRRGGETLLSFSRNLSYSRKPQSGVCSESQQKNSPN